MRFVRRYILSTAALLVLTLSSIFVIEAGHHHEGMEDNDGCSVCAFQQNVSTAPATPAPPDVAPLYRITSLWFFHPIFVSVVFVSPSGRSPPFFPQA